MKPPALAIFTAVKLEAGAIAAALQMARPSPRQAVTANFEGVRVFHHLIGIAGAGLGDRKLAERPDYILMAGVAGALDPTLAVGDLILADCPEQIAAGCAFRRGIIHSSSSIISSPAQKAELFNSLGATAVDMESAIVRQWAASQGIPFIALRAISDTASQQLDPATLSLVDAWGNPRPCKVLQFLASNPLRTASLIQLGRDSKLAAHNVAQAVVTLIRQIARIHPVP